MSTYNLLTPCLSLMRMPASLTTAHILVIIENTSVQEMVVWALELAGCTHLTRGSRDLSLLAPLTYGNPPEAILFDVGLLLESGSQMVTDFQTAMRALGIRAPIIVLTTSPDIQYEVEALGYRTLLKPFHVQDLLEAIHTTLS